MNLQIAVVEIGGNKIAVEHGKQCIEISALNANGVEQLIKITAGDNGLKVAVNSAFLQDMREPTVWGQFVDVENVK